MFIFGEGTGYISDASFNDFDDFLGSRSNKIRHY